MVALTHPNPEFYSISKGELKWTPTGGSQRSLGNCSEIELTPEITKLDHYSSLSGIRSKDKSVVTETKLTIRIMMEEISAENLKLLLMGGSITTGQNGDKTFDVLDVSSLEGALTFTGSNTVGSQIDLSFPKVSFSPSGSLNMISEEWNTIEITGEVLLDSGSYGNITVTEKTA